MAKPGPKPLTRQRSPWTRGADLTLLGTPTPQWRRHVHDGDLIALVAHEPTGWHLSISHRATGRTPRYPTWDEITHARYELLPDDVTVALLLPPAAEYTAIHATTFHLWEINPEAHP